MMAYNSIQELPENVKNHLPEHAQEIFAAAFNSAVDQYNDEVRAFRVAWSAVERDYEKGENGQWRKKSA